jgi:radical SAM protein with 4Fe4S-binding SPASM domain
MHPKIIEMVKYVSDKGIEPAMSVNPKLLTKKMCEGLIGAGLKVMIISLDAIDDETYKKMRGENANYNEAVENVNTLLKVKEEKKSDLYISIQMVRTKDNKQDSKVFKENWNLEGINKVEVKHLITFDGSNKRVIEQGDEETLSKKFREMKRKSCTWGWFSVAILWDGRVVACCYDYDGKYVVGDLNKETLEDIWNNDKMKRLRRQIKAGAYYENPLCRDCYDTREVKQ